jgi:Acyl-CoA synthetase (NDP forming)
MITQQLISPNSIVVVGGSDDITKPGGNALKNLLDTKYSGDLYVVNPKNDIVQGVKSYRQIEDLPNVDCAILAIPAKLCVEATRVLCRDKGCRAIIIFSAGFHEDGPEGAELERQIVDIVNEYGASLIGPNCIGVITNKYAGVFTHPISNLSPDGVDIVSGSGATVVFIMEAAVKHGIKFSNVFSVGNSAQIGVEDVLKYLDETYIHGVSPQVKLLYIESVKNPQLLLKHAKSLILKGAKIAAIKAGYSEAGSRAASSHTGALASPDKAVEALFKKAGIIRVFSRTELVTMAAILSFPKPKGNRIAIITHAGGPAVMLTDILNSGGVDIPAIKGKEADELLEKLYPGSSVSNPIDFLATGTAAQLADIIDACNNHFDVDAMAVIFGSPGLTDVTDVYKVLLGKIASSKKPIYPILPSVVNAKDAIETYQRIGGISFSEEVDFGKAYINMINTPTPEEEITLPPIDKELVRNVIDSSENGYLLPEQVQQLLDAAGINRAKEVIVNNLNDCLEAAREVGYPLAMKVIGPIHKTDVGGVSLNVADDNTLSVEFERMIKIKDTTAILLQPMLSGTEIFVGGKKEGDFGSIVMCGLGGIFIEALKDVNSALAPISNKEAKSMIEGLKGYKIIKGIRGIEGVNEIMFNETIRRVSALLIAAPEIAEMDLNPLLGNASGVVAVDGRIRIEK